METPIRFEDEIISLIKGKQELSSLDDDFIRGVLRKKLASFRAPELDKYVSFKQFKRSAFCKQLLSETRKYLRDVYGVFLQKPLSAFSPLLDSMTAIDDGVIDRLLEAHQSTRERVPYYDEVYSLIWGVCKNHGVSEESFSVLDLACGWNPFALKFFPVTPSSYFASDLSSEDMALVRRFLENTGIDGDARAFNLLSSEFTHWLDTLPFVDVCFLFKALDSLEYSSRHSSKKLLSKLSSKCRLVVVSFSRVSIGGRQEIDAKRRSWFETWCEKNGWVFEVSSVPTELFYICT
ncbi:MAG: hypothetical protein ACLFTH_02170, partial [Candidatus Woesearchaeota archaeon]